MERTAISRTRKSKNLQWLTFNLSHLPLSGTQGGRRKDADAFVEGCGQSLSRVRHSRIEPTCTRAGGGVRDDG